MRILVKSSCIFKEHGIQEAKATGFEYVKNEFSRHKIIFYKIAIPLKNMTQFVTNFYLQTGWFCYFENNMKKLMHFITV